MQIANAVDAAACPPEEITQAVRIKVLKMLYMVEVRKVGGHQFLELVLLIGHPEIQAAVTRKHSLDILQHGKGFAQMLKNIKADYTIDLEPSSADLIQRAKYLVSPFLCKCGQAGITLNSDRRPGDPFDQVKKRTGPASEVEYTVPSQLASPDLLQPEQIFRQRLWVQLLEIS